jgi:hypothetical protein
MAVRSAGLSISYLIWTPQTYLLESNLVSTCVPQCPSIAITHELAVGFIGFWQKIFTPLIAVLSPVNGSILVENP